MVLCNTDVWGSPWGEWSATSDLQTSSRTWPCRRHSSREPAPEVDGLLSSELQYTDSLSFSSSIRNVCHRNYFDRRTTDTVMCVVRRSNNTFGDWCFAFCCHHIYASVIVSDNLNCCSRLICLVLETEALCDISVMSAVYKSSYLLTYNQYNVIQ